MIDSALPMKFKDLSRRLRMALIEDDAFHDVTSLQIPSFRSETLTADIIAKDGGVFCGGVLIKDVLSQLTSKATLKIYKKDGASVRKGEKIARLRAPAGALLAGERLILNLTTHLSGIATLTRRYVQSVNGTGAKIFDTRKTTPLWRDLEKYAVRCGGGYNHRKSLGDAILVKDNHNDYLKKKGAPPALTFRKDRLRVSPRNKLQFVAMEARSYKEVWNAIKARADIVLLDNMDLKSIKNSIVFVKAARKALGVATPLVEVSGGVTPERATELARLGVDRISVGRLTHSAPALDMSLEVI